MTDVSLLVDRRDTPRVAHYLNLCIISVCIANIALVLSGIHSPVRVFFTALIVVFGPGSGFVQFMQFRDAALQLGATIATSIAASLIVAQILLMLHNLNPFATMLILTGLTLIRPISASDSSQANRLRRDEHPGEAS